MSFAFYTPASADTKLIHNQDTGAKVGLSADNKIIGKTKVETQTQTTTATNVTAENDTDSDKTSTDASGGILVKNEIDADKRIQDLGEAEAGVQATATTKIDLR